MLSWIASCCHGSPKKGPIGEEAGVMSCRPAMLRGCKAGLFTHPVLLSLPSALAQLTTKGKKKTITPPCRVKNKRKHRTRETSAYHSYGPFHTFPIIVFVFSWSKRIILKSQVFHTLQPSNSTSRKLSERTRRLHRHKYTSIYCCIIPWKQETPSNVQTKTRAMSIMVQLHNGILWTPEENPCLYLVIENYAFSHTALNTIWTWCLFKHIRTYEAQLIGT